MEQQRARIIVKRQRIVSFDALKLFAIYLVIWGHCINWFQSGNGEENFMYRIIYSFHMPLFMMISGYFSYSSIKDSFSHFIKKKFRSLIYPCLVWGFILWILLEPIHSFHYGSNVFSIWGLCVDFYWLSDFWFLKSCFICYCLLYLSVHSGLNKIIWIPLSILISQGCTPFYISFMYPCFIIGWIIRDNECYMRLLTKKCLVFIIIFCTMLLFWNLNAWTKSHGIPNNLFEYNANDIIEIIFFRFFRLFIGIIGSLSFISLFQLIFDNNKSKLHPQLIEIFSKWGRYTLETYIFQSILIERILHRYIDVSTLKPYWFIYTTIISIIILILCIYVTMLIQRSQFFSKTLWGKP